MDVRIVVGDVGLGNLRSVERALSQAAEQRRRVIVTRETRADRTADKLVMPGQSAFGDYARALSGDVGEAGREHVRAGRPYLGICMGLQVLFEASEEAPGCAGLGVIAGEVVKLPARERTRSPESRSKCRMSLEQAEVTENHGLLPPGPGDPLHFYFVHSFVVAPRDAASSRRRPTTANGS